MRTSHGLFRLKTHSPKKEGRGTLILGIVLFIIALLGVMLSGGCTQQTHEQKTALEYVEETVHAAQLDDMVIAVSAKHDLAFLFIVHGKYDGAYITGTTSKYRSTWHRATIGSFYQVMNAGEKMGHLTLIPQKKCQKST